MLCDWRERWPAAAGHRSSRTGQQRALQELVIALWKLWCLLCAGLTSPFAGCGEVETDRLGEHSGGAEFSASSSPARTEDRRALDAPQNESGQVVVEASIQKALQRQRIRREQDLRCERERARRSQEEARYQQEQDRQNSWRAISGVNHFIPSVAHRRHAKRRIIFDPGSL